jgi:hypothetical protein
MRFEYEISPIYNRTRRWVSHVTSEAGTLYERLCLIRRNLIFLWPIHSQTAFPLFLFDLPADWRGTRKGILLQ